VLAVLGLAACARDLPSLGAARHAITDGVADPGDPAVVALASSGMVNCSGVLISSRVVLSAAHCVPDPSMLADISVSFGGDLASPSTLIPVLEATAHPAFDVTTLSNDLGLFLLGAHAPASPVSLLGQPFDASFVGMSTRLVGFGQTVSGGPLDTTKRVGQAIVADFSDQTFTLHPDPSLTCGGDSGGPAFLSLGGSEYLAGVTSRGDADCAQYAIDTRVDAFTADFIQPFVDATAEGSQPVGARCRYDENCASGACLHPSDTTHLMYCSAACHKDADCPQAMRCQAASCRYPLPSPGALGASCTMDSECEDGRCARPRPGAPTVCSMRCFTTNNPACPAGFECLADPDRANRSACFRASGGCAVAAGGAPAGPWPWLLLLLVIVSRARRRRRDA
jgi:MYXO-CTERM domain-containing protein